jgi:ABC-type transporter Mla subunit MlaD
LEARKLLEIELNMNTDKLTADVALVTQRLQDEMEGVASFADTVENQVDCLEDTIKEVAQATMLLDEIIMHTTGLAQENAVVIRSIVKRFDGRFADLERRITSLERRL